MHEPLFAESVRPAAISCLGLSLRPYSIGHELLLWRASNPLATYNPESFAELDSDQQNAALIEAVDVCSQSWIENQFIPANRWQAWRYNRVCRQWKRAIKNCLWPVELAKFQTYRSDGTRDFPTTKMPRVGSAPFHYFGAPETARLLNYVSTQHAALVTHYGTPFDFPFALAQMLCLTQLESNGDAWIKNYFDVQAELKARIYDESNPANTFANTPETIRASAEKWNAEHPAHPVPLEY